MREIFKFSHWDEVIEIGLERKKSKYFDRKKSLFQLSRKNKKLTIFSTLFRDNHQI